MEYNAMLPGTSAETQYIVNDARMEWEPEDDGTGEVDAVFTLPVVQNDENASTPKDKVTSGSSRTVVNDPDIANGITLNIDADGDFDIASAPVVPAPQSFEVPALQATTSKAKKSHNLVIDSLLGQANLLSARGNVPDPIKLLHDIVRQEPRRPEAYFQLAHIYENQGLELKSFEHRLLGCNVDRKTSENDWDATGDIAITLGKHEEAAACFKKATKVAPKQWIYYEKQIRSCEQTGHVARAMKTRLVAAQNVDCHAHGFDFDWLVSMIKSVVDYYNDNYDENKCINALMVHIQRCVEFNVDCSEQHEILVTQLLRRVEYSRAAESIVAICSGFMGLDQQGHPGWTITEKSTAFPWPPVRIATIEVSPNFPTLMLCRLVLCFSRMKQVRLASLVYDEMFRRGFNVNTAGLYADVAKVFLELEEYEHGETFTSNLLRYTNFVNDAELFYLHGLFNDKLNKLDIAERQYRHAISLDSKLVNGMDPEEQPGNCRRLRRTVTPGLNFLHNQNDAVCETLCLSYVVYCMIVDCLTADIVRGVLDGYNGAVIAYGQTSLGKTFTMEGRLDDPEQKGIIPRTADDLFQQVQNMSEADLNFSLKVSYFEIYNEKVRDLLVSSEKNFEICVRKDGTSGVQNLSERQVGNSNEIYGYFMAGQQNRKVRATDMNKDSSRSDSVFLIQATRENEKTKKKLVGNLYLVDLAGSEKVNDAGVRGTGLTRECFEVIRADSNKIYGIRKSINF